MKNFITSNNISIILGQNDVENWKIISDYKKINENYIWMHLDSYPSGHIIILSEIIDNELLKYAGNICKDNTKYRNIPNLKLCYTKLSNIKKGDKAGEVYFKQNKLVNFIKI